MNTAQRSSLHRKANQAVLLQMQQQMNAQLVEQRISQRRHRPNVIDSNMTETTPGWEDRSTPSPSYADARSQYLAIQIFASLDSQYSLSMPIVFNSKAIVDNGISITYSQQRTLNTDLFIFNSFVNTMAV